MTHFKTIVAALQYVVQKQGDAPAFIFRDKHHVRQVMTWNSLYTTSGRFAAILRNDGVGRGSLVVNCLVNSPERVVSDTGVMMAGAATVSGNCLLADRSDLLRTIRVSRAATLLVDPDVPNSFWNVLKNHVTLDDDNNVKSDSLPDLKKVYFVRRVEGQKDGDFMGSLEKCQDWFQADDVTADDCVYVFSTSGTTGLSKFVMHSHGNYTLGEWDSTQDIALANRLTMLNTASLNFIAGFLGIQFLQGLCRILCDIRAGLPEDMAGFIWRCIQDEKCNFASFSAVYLRRLEQLSHNEKEQNLSPFWKPSMLFMGGHPISQTMVKAGFAIAESVFVAYGSTEANFISNMKINDVQGYTDHDSGKPIKGIEVKIVNPNNEDQVLPTNQLGNVLVRRNQFMMQGYLNDPEATAAAFTQDEYLRMDDLGLLDDRGHLIVAGRRNDAIMTGSYTFYPFWLEKRIRKCPGVIEVIIVGIPDAHVNEEPCACLLLDTNQVTIEEVRHFVEEDIPVPENKPESPRPRYYLRFETFPKNSNGKPQRQVLKNMAAERLSSSKAQDTDTLI